MENYWELSKTLPNAENQDMVNEFLLNIKLANHSPGTVDLYRCFLEHFFGDKEEAFSAITSDSILQWFIKNQGHVKETTLSLRLSILASFYNFCIQEDYVEQSPIKRRWFPRLPKPIPKYLEKGELAKTRLKSEVSDLRDQTMMEFMLSSGCRVSELSSLKISDIDWENRTARVVGKGKKIREVHFSEKAAILLERYLGNTTKQTTDLLNVNHDRKIFKIGPRRIQQLVHEIGERAELNNRLFPHRLRHTFATELLTKGAELSFIADELGHSSIETTRIYARLPKSEIISLYRKYMG